MITVSEFVVSPHSWDLKACFLFLVKKDTATSRHTVSAVLFSLLTLVSSSSLSDM